MIKIYIHTYKKRSKTYFIALGFFGDQEVLNIEKEIKSDLSAARYVAVLETIEIISKQNLSPVKILHSNKLMGDQISRLKNSNIFKIKVLLNKINKGLADKGFTLEFISKSENPAAKLAKENSSLTREEKAQELTRNVFIKKDKKYIYLKENSSYEIDIENMTCTCHDFLVRGGFCKHIIAAIEIEKKLSDRR